MRSKDASALQELTIQQRLMVSDGVKSLVAEQDAIKILAHLDWAVYHSWFYADPKTGKSREVDLQARFLWHRFVKKRYQSCLVNLCIEVKTLKGYHLVFAPAAGHHHGTECQHDWIGYREQPLETLLRDAGLPGEATTAVASKFQRFAFPRDRMRIRDFAVDPPHADIVCSAFRETNTGTDRELEASVLWKSLQTVASAKEAEQVRRKTNDMDQLRSALATAGGKRSVAVKRILHELRRQAEEIELFHPAIVISAALWQLSPRGPRALRWCRFASSGYGLGLPWCDVVHADAFPEWARLVSRHYNDRLLQAGSKSSELAGPARRV